MLSSDIRRMLSSFLSFTLDSPMLVSLLFVLLVAGILSYGLSMIAQGRVSFIHERAIMPTVILGYFSTVIGITALSLYLFSFYMN